MKIKRVKEKQEIQIESLFYFLNYTGQNISIDFIKSLNLADEQYYKLAEIMEDYAKERYDDGRQDGLEQCQD